MQSIITRARSDGIDRVLGVTRVVCVHIRDEDRIHSHSFPRRTAINNNFFLLINLSDPAGRGVIVMDYNRNSKTNQ